jgi:glutathione S-transferase
LEAKRSAHGITNFNKILAIEDPNTDVTIWESGAIIQYLVNQYDTEKRLHYDTLKEQNLCNQWLMFQVSGQGPYFGQCTWLVDAKGL